MLSYLKYGIERWVRHYSSIISAGPLAMTMFWVLDGTSLRTYLFSTINKIIKHGKQNESRAGILTYTGC